MSSFKRSSGLETSSWLLQMSGFVIWTTSFGKLAVGWSFGISFWFHGRGTSADLSVSVSSGTSLGACDPSMSSWLGEYQQEENGLYVHWFEPWTFLIFCKPDLCGEGLGRLQHDHDGERLDHHRCRTLLLTAELVSPVLVVVVVFLFCFFFGGEGRLNIAKGSASPRVTPFKSPKHYWVS